MAVSWRDRVDGGIEAQPALVVEVIPAEREQRGVMTMTDLCGAIWRCLPSLEHNGGR